RPQRLEPGLERRIRSKGQRVERDGEAERQPNNNQPADERRRVRKLPTLPGGERDGVRGTRRLIKTSDRNHLTRRASRGDLSPLERGEKPVSPCVHLPSEL